MTLTSSSSDSNEIYLAAIEGGGTTFVVSVARVIPSGESTTTDDDNGNKILRIGPKTLQILHTATIPPKNTDTGEILNLNPTQILEETCTFLRLHLPPSGKYSAVGIATFGPAGVDPAQICYGTILSGSPKKEWRNVDLLTPIAQACGLSNDTSKVGFDTDVNAPALAEFRHRSFEQRLYQKINKPLTSLSYITIGTGVGVGLILNSQPIHGLLHPEGGHVAIQPLEGDAFQGYSWGTEKSPYGGVGTVEGVASSVALTERLLQMENVKGGKGGIESSNAQTREILSTLPDTHPVWTHASNAIANLCVSLLLLTSCQKIVLGGGIMKRTILYDMVRKRVWTLLNGYLDSVDELSAVEKLDDVIVESSWEEMGSGLVGAFALALDAHESSNSVEKNDGEKEEENTMRQLTESSGENVIEEKEKRRKDNDDDEGEQQQQSFTSGVLAGIGLSFGCVLLSSLLGQGRRRRGQ
mmetsp:Transcript_19556/g.31943  ORF Transcript_19556/g.31943 Transcript_19556/m.31943 type:complete len:469 (+) Transcript_19556:1-1407(+)|eukprot:CAMPEP_0201916816 /NCGR_PEP_ID=MMETSP0903-20130614/6372_1 /ASSEMBLY_ACC=CAM_ASM_000552 /TAXON_ID=420261 /ORGANISM="Thalassiosira antarctica, Strain CCMP982" /LENGTH=468 /DNA_ID=CAMNT_0048452743 /DNA_START=1 /DNA_END=1407 /DNA_ORIENTATION=+